MIEQLPVKSFALTLERALQNTSHVLVATHANPDGDALASLSAFAQFLTFRRIPFTLFAEKYDGEYLHQLPFVQNILTTSSSLKHLRFDAIVLLDVHSFERSQIPSPATPLPSFAIDHHQLDIPTTKARYQLNLVQHTSTTSILVELFPLLSFPISDLIANILLVGIITDCELFHNHATNELTFLHVAKLISCGANINRMNSFALGAYSLSALKSLGEHLHHIQVNTTYNAGILFSEKPFKSDIANILKRTNMPETVFILHADQQSSLIETSMRSPSRNVGSLARLLGGGGHPKAAGFRLKGQLVEKEGKWSII